MAATIKDIAARTGLGVATISSYLNGGHVRDKNRVLIEEAIDALDYKVNVTARGLKTDSTRTIGVIIPELSSKFCGNVISRAEDVLRTHGYAMLICDCRSDREREREEVEFLLSRRVDGLITIPTDETGSHLEPFIRAGKPVVLVDRVLDSLPCDAVCVDNRRALRTAVEHLCSFGHRAIGMVAGPTDIAVARNRLRGYRDACEEHGIPCDDSWVWYGDDSIAGGSEGIAELMRRHPEMTAVAVSNYQMSMGVIIGLNEREIPIPERISVVGFDNPEFARACNPKLTIVNQPVQEIGQKAAELLLSRLKLKRGRSGQKEGQGAGEEEEKAPVRYWLETELIQGRSVRRIG